MDQDSTQTPVPMKTFEVDQLVGAEGYKLLTGLVVPRPIGWIGSRSPEGANNLAPYSFFNAISGKPPTVVFSPAHGDAVRRDTADNVLATGVFTVNVVTAEVVEAMNATAASLEAGEDEFAHAGVTPIEATHIDAPMVAECKARYECRMVDHLIIGAESDGNVLIVGQVVAFHVAEHLLDGTRVDQAELRAVGRHAGNLYSNATDLFDLVRPA